MTEKNTAKILWFRVLITGLAIVLSVFLLLMLVTLIYGLVQGFKERGAPDTELINQFAENLWQWLSPLLLVVLAYFGGTLTSRKAGSLYILHGVLVGIVVALFSFLETKLFGGGLDLREGLYLLFYIVAAGLGGFKATPKKGQRGQPG
jgi:putative membrane protein (TIGR04086 family)